MTNAKQCFCTKDVGKRFKLKRHYIYIMRWWCQKGRTRQGSRVNISGDVERADGCTVSRCTGEGTLSCLDWFCQGLVLLAAFVPDEEHNLRRQRVTQVVFRPRETKTARFSPTRKIDGQDDLFVRVNTCRQKGTM